MYVWLCKYSARRLLWWHVMCYILHSYDVMLWPLSADVLLQFVTAADSSSGQVIDISFGRVVDESVRWRLLSTVPWLVVHEWSTCHWRDSIAQSWSAAGNAFLLVILPLDVQAGQTHVECIPVRCYQRRQFSAVIVMRSDCAISFCNFKLVIVFEGTVHVA